MKAIFLNKKANLYVEDISFLIVFWVSLSLDTWKIY